MVFEYDVHDIAALKIAVSEGEAYSRLADVACARYQRRHITKVDPGLERHLYPLVEPMFHTITPLSLLLSTHGVRADGALAVAFGRCNRAANIAAVAIDDGKAQATAEDDIAGAHHRTEALGHLSQNTRAGPVTAAVGDCLEIGELHHDQRMSRAARPRAVDRACDSFFEFVAIDEPSRHAESAAMQQPFDQRMCVAELMQHDANPVLFLRSRDDGRRRQLHGHLNAVAALNAVTIGAGGIGGERRRTEQLDAGGMQAHHRGPRLANGMDTWDVKQIFCRRIEITDGVPVVDRDIRHWQGFHQVPPQGGREIAGGGPVQKSGTHYISHWGSLQAVRLFPKKSAAEPRKCGSEANKAHYSR